MEPLAPSDEIKKLNKEIKTLEAKRKTVESDTETIKKSKIALKEMIEKEQNEQAEIRAAIMEKNARVTALRRAREMEELEKYLELKTYYLFREFDDYDEQLMGTFDSMDRLKEEASKHFLEINWTGYTFTGTEKNEYATCESDDDTYEVRGRVEIHERNTIPGQHYVLWYKTECDC